MNTIIRKMIKDDREAVLSMMRVFYNSSAVHTNGSEEIFCNDFENCINDNPYLEGFVFVKDEEVVGYAMLAKSFSTEFGKPCIWIEDIYFKEEARGLGLGTTFFHYIHEKYTDVIFRLEAEEDNVNAVHLYEKCGYRVMPYLEFYLKPEKLDKTAV